MKSIGTREYRAALKGDSWKFQCINDIEQAMTMVGSKDEFIALMESAGYTVTRTDSHKYITYTCPNGMKLRDNKLHESKFLKESMQYEFAIRQQQSGTDQLGVQQAQSRVEVGASNNGHTSRGDDGVPDTEGAKGSVSRVYVGGDDVSFGAVRGAAAEVVRTIFKLYIDGYGYKRIANHLTDQSIPTPRMREKARKKAVGDEYKGKVR